MSDLIVLHGVRTVQLRGGLSTLIDEADWDSVSARNWGVQKSGRLRYAARSVYRDGGSRKLGLHRFLLDAPAGSEVDHRNGDTLDNRRANLRVCTRSENGRNLHRTCGLSKYKGVHYDKRGGRWIAQIRIQGGRFRKRIRPDERSAALAYDEMARAEFGEFACTNADMGVYQ